MSKAGPQSVQYLFVSYRDVVRGIFDALRHCSLDQVAVLKALNDVPTHFLSYDRVAVVVNQRMHDEIKISDRDTHFFCGQTINHLRRATSQALPGS
jgi:hypothetical protein